MSEFFFLNHPSLLKNQKILAKFNLHVDNSYNLPSIFENVDSAIDRINHYQLDTALCFSNNYCCPLHTDSYTKKALSLVP